MSDISIKWAKADGLLLEFDNSRRELSGAVSRMRDEAQNMGCLRTARGRQISSSIHRIAGEVNVERENLRRLESGLRSILRLYGNCENQLLDKNMGSLLLKMTGTAGTVGGSGITLVDAFVNGNIIGAIQDLLELAPNAVPILQGQADTEWFKQLFGLDANESQSLLHNALGLPEGAIQTDAVKSMLTTHPLQTGGSLFKEALKSQWDGWKPPVGSSGVEDWLKPVCKWAGAAFSTLTNGMENFQEFDGFTGRMIGETVVETVTDVGMDIAVGAAVSAGVTALAVAAGVAGAPAVVVGAVTVGAVWALNSLCSWATGGKDVGEVVADFVCDTAEKLGDAAKNLWGRIKQSVGRSVSPGGAAVPA